MNFIKSTICYFAGHNPIDKITEDNECFWESACKRCNCALGVSLDIKTCRLNPDPDWNRGKAGCWDVFLDFKVTQFRKQIESESQSL